MRILIDIGHPAHVHYFKNFIKIMTTKGHKFVITARNKEVAQTLLNYYKYDFISRGKGGRGVIGKLLYMLWADLIILKTAFREKPDVFLSFASPYASHIAWLMRKPHIAFDDTEHSKYEHLLYVPFTKAVLTPTCFFKELGVNQIFFKSYMELCYLHIKYFSPDIEVLNSLGLIKDEKYVILRFVSFGAGHDIGQFGISLKTKSRIIEFLSTKFRVFISSESELPDYLSKYKLQVHPAHFHSILANAYLYIGEGSTTASECAVLGVPNIYVNSLTVGYCKEQNDKYGLCIHLKEEDQLINEIEILLDNINLLEDWQERKNKMLKDKIDPTAFMVWFVENYPQSFHTMKENPDFQNKFKENENKTL